MEIIKILNNNAVICLKGKKEVIVSAPGIGFTAKKGSNVQNYPNIKIYYPEVEPGSLGEIIDKIPSEFIELSQEILEKARSDLPATLSDTLLITLADHIATTVYRYRQDIHIPNLLLEEIHLLYPNELKIGFWAVDLVERRFSVKLSVDEAGYIALHIINNDGKNKSSNAVIITQMIFELVEIIQETLRITVNKKSLEFRRLSTHLKFLISQLIEQETVFNDNPATEFIILKENQQLLACLSKIEYYFKLHNYELSKEQLTYLYIHLIGFI